MDTGLVRRLPLAESVREEVENGQDRLPSRVAERALAGHVDAYAESVAARCTAGLPFAAAEVVWMPKANLRYRPLSAVPVAERAVLRALATELARTVTPADAYVDTRATFRTELLDDERGFTAFALADVGSFFQYVSHDLLRRRIVEAGGRAELADTVGAVLGQIMPTSFGLQQGVSASFVFADLVIAPIERRLARKGIPVARYNDDFRLAGNSTRAVLHALQELQTELYAVGLTLNEGKTAILDREAYGHHTALALAGEREEARRDADATGAVEQLHAALGRPAGAGPRRAEALPVDGVRIALQRLLRARDPSAVSLGRAVIDRHPALTQTYGRYCAALVRAGHGDQVFRYLDTVFPHLTLCAWQELWLLEPLLASAQPIQGRLRTWLTSRLADKTPALLRSRAALVAARAGLLGPAEASSIVDAVSEVARPDAVLAFSLVNNSCGPGEQVLAGLRDAVLAGWVYRHGRSAAR
jgi:Reverse transcriptase (RNA-dependent DNA polymerase)